MPQVNIRHVLLSVLLVYRRRRLHKRKWWIHPIISNRKSEGMFHTLHNKLRKYSDNFFEFYRMSQNSFDYLLQAVSPSLKKKDTNLREAIGIEEKLSVTLRYLATGCSMRSLHFQYRLGRKTIRTIVKETCEALWDSLQSEYMKIPSEEDWINIADKFERKSNFPNSIGAIDRKHIRIVKPEFSGSNYFNYKHYFSVVLMAVADADYCYTYINVGSYGSLNDSNVLKSTKFGQDLYSGNLQIPKPKPIKNTSNIIPYPFVFVADEAFVLSNTLLRPFPIRALTPERRVFNYRLSRARRYVECAFGLLANKWRILHRPLDVNIELADCIIKTCCILHNYVRKNDGYNFEDTLSCDLESITPQGVRGTINGVNVRNMFLYHFNSKEGSIPWQNKYM